MLLAAGAGVAAYFFVSNKMEEAGLALSAAAAAGGAPAVPGAGTGTDSSGAPLGGACAKAAECCRKIMQKQSAGAQSEAGCLALKQLPEASCEQPLQAYKQSSALLGVNCD